MTLSDIVKCENEDEDEDEDEDVRYCSSDTEEDEENTTDTKHKMFLEKLKNARPSIFETDFENEVVEFVNGLAVDSLVDECSDATSRTWTGRKNVIIEGLFDIPSDVSITILPSSSDYYLKSSYSSEDYNLEWQEVMMKLFDPTIVFFLLDHRSIKKISSAIVKRQWLQQSKNIQNVIVVCTKTWTQVNNDKGLKELFDDQKFKFITSDKLPSIKEGCLFMKDETVIQKIKSLMFSS